MSSSPSNIPYLAGNDRRTASSSPEPLHIALPRRSSTPRHAPVTFSSVPDSITPPLAIDPLGPPSEARRVSWLPSFNSFPIELSDPAAVDDAGSNFSRTESLSPQLHQQKSGFHEEEGGHNEAREVTGRAPIKRGMGFYMIAMSLSVSTLMSGIDMTGLGTSLPTIAADLGGADYSWIGSAFILTSTAFIPVTGSMASIVGRRPTLLAGLVLFAIGSAICGAAPNMNAMIAGRAIQGAGGGCIVVMTEIVIVDLIPLAERGNFFGFIGMIWAVSSGVGSPIGGILAQKGRWRWFFYMNLPISAVAITCVALFLNVKTPRTTWKERWAQMDWANSVFVASATSCIIAMSWAGDTYAWASWRVLVPLMVGLAGLAVWLLLEATVVKHPTIPFSILSHKMSLLGYFLNFLHGLSAMAVVYYFPTYFQACKGASPLRSGIDLFSLSFSLAPFGMIAGIIITVTGKYKWMNVVGWAFQTLGLGLMTTLKADSITAAWVGYTVIFGVGAGILFCAPLFPILAPLQLSEQPAAMVFHAFTRLFGNTWGVAVGITILQDRIKKFVPAEFLARLGTSRGIVYAAIPSISTLEEPLQHQVREAYADSLRVVWIAFACMAGVGLIASLFIQDLGLAKETDEAWGMADTDATSFFPPETVKMSSMAKDLRPANPRKTSSHSVGGTSSRRLSLNVAFALDEGRRRSVASLYRAS